MIIWRYDKAWRWAGIYNVKSEFAAYCQTIVSCILGF